jgi:cytochrome c553
MNKHDTMLINKKIMATLGIASVITLAAFTSMPPEKEGFKDLDVLPKNITEKQLHSVMREWSMSLGVHCGFCHAPNADGKGLDFPSNAKPEKEMARHMFKMMNKINQKYFEAKKDSLGMMAKTGINCYTCHRGTSHPEVKLPEMQQGPGGPPPGAGGPPPGGGGPDSPPKQ